MAERKYYVICEMGCKFESMTKEQILTAIAQAVESGEIKDVDTGFVKTVKTINGAALRFFYGTQSEYEALAEEDKSNLFAIITNDTTKEAFNRAIEELQSEMTGLQDNIIGLHADIDALKDGTVIAGSAHNLVKTLASGRYVRETGLYCFFITDGAGWHGTSMIYIDCEDSAKKTTYGTVCGAVDGTHGFVYHSRSDYSVTPVVVTSSGTSTTASIVGRIKIC